MRQIGTGGNYDKSSQFLSELTVGKFEEKN